MAISACSLVVDSGRPQCKTDSDCAARGAAFAGTYCINSLCQPDPTWSCLDEATTDETSDQKVEVILTAQDLLTKDPVAGVKLTLCGTIDADCAREIDHFVSDANGKLDVFLNSGFSGYFQTEGDQIYPTLFFPPNTRKQRAPSTLPMVTTTLAETMFSNIAELADDHSVILTTALDCLGRPAAGMTLSMSTTQMDEKTVPYLLESGLPSLRATATDEDGAGGFVNVKTGGAVITSTIAATGRKAGSAAVQARAGHFSMVLIVPTGG